MTTAIAGKKIVIKSKRRAPQQEQKPKGAGRKTAKSQSSSWKTILMVVGLLGMMAFLFTPNDPDAVKAGSSTGFSQGVLGK